MGAGITLPLLNVVFGMIKSVVDLHIYAVSDETASRRQIYYPVLCLCRDSNTRRRTVSEPAKPAFVCLPSFLPRTIRICSSISTNYMPYTVFTCSVCFSVASSSATSTRYVSFLPAAPIPRTLSHTILACFPYDWYSNFGRDPARFSQRPLFAKCPCIGLDASWIRNFCHYFFQQHRPTWNIREAWRFLRVQRYHGCVHYCCLHLQLAAFSRHIYCSRFHFALRRHTTSSHYKRQQAPSLGMASFDYLYLTATDLVRLVRRQIYLCCERGFE